MTVLARERAYAKLNLCLFLGPIRGDGRHELVTLFDSVGLCDELVVTEGEGADRVVCEGVEGDNLVAAALAALRAEADWRAPPVTVTIDKRIPVAAGMAGGSADAAAMLRCAPRIAPVAESALRDLAAGLGSDVPGQLRPGPSVGTGAGDLIEPVAQLAPYGVLVIPRSFALSTADVYREADRLGLPRSPLELRARHTALLAALDQTLTTELMVNDLGQASLSLAPRIADGLAAAVDAGADRALVCGSGPTVIGIFTGADGGRRAGDAASALREQFPGTLATVPVASSQ